MPSSSVTLVNRDSLLNAIVLHFTIYSQKAELDDIKRGMDDVLEVGPLARSHPTLFKPLFVSSGLQKLQADTFLSLFHVDYSLRGSNRRDKEEQIMINFNHYIQELEGVYNYVYQIYETGGLACTFM